MAFSGLSFPSLQYGNKFRDTRIKSELPVQIVQNGGFEYRVLRFPVARLSWQIPATNLTWQDKETLLAFSNQLGGPLNSFLYTDPEHNTISNYVLGAGTQIAAPAAPTLAAVTGGTLPAGTYYYEVTAYSFGGVQGGIPASQQGETIASAQAYITTTSTGSITVSWGAVPGAAGYRVYGRLQTGIYFIADVGNVLTVTDTGAVTPVSAVVPPTTNLSGTLTYPLNLPIAGLAHPIFHPAGLTIAPSNYTITTPNGVPLVTYPEGSAPLYGTSVTVSGTYQLAARFDGPLGYALANAVNPSSSAAKMDMIKLVEVFE